MRRCRRVKSPLESFLLQPSIASFNSRSAPTKLVPLSDLITSGSPLRLTNCPNAIMKASVSSDGTSSRTMARVVKQVKRHPQHFVEPLPHLTTSGPKKSTSENIKGGLYGCSLSLGRGAMTCFTGLSFSPRHLKHFLMMFFAKPLPPIIQNIFSSAPGFALHQHGPDFRDSGEQSND